ncbi:GTP-binding protein [Cohnella sp. LGH]|uniref:CobW family GTP-binding protein n=1 Tax=Cohnella sp. LGH TaxID=1619153 RepID=UPI001AD97F8C|nr:GTP-binding protein [Cohnella sp. LGH]QTH45130.1 GTP-binding protein [Cohnella sp. LGH]
MDQLIPVYVLTGFLGSGKTTLLNRILEDGRVTKKKVAVLLNEVGDANVEGQLLGKDVPMAEMLGGCICCSIRADLGMELTKLAREHRPDVIWIETTGIARPLEVMDAVTEASMYEKLELRGVVAVADARHLLDRVRIGAGKTYKLMREQIEAAGFVVLNKTDLVAPAELAELEGFIADWNPHAWAISTVRTELNLDAIYRMDHNVSAPAERQEAICPPGCTHDHEHQHSHEHAHDPTHDHVKALTYYLPGPVDSRIFEEWVAGLPEGVYRGKGIVTFRDTSSRFLFQYAYRESDYMRITPQGTVHDVVVLIGEGFPRESLLKQLERLCLD